MHVLLPGLHLELETDAGVFSADRLDPGTRLLLDTAPAPPPTGDLVDVGCGYGPLALVLAARSPAARVWAVDVNEAHWVCVRATRPGPAGQRARGSAHRARVAGRVDAIWSNPPLRIGKQALHTLLAGWLGRLTPQGSAHLVVQRHLGSDSLHRWLEAEGWPVRRVASRAG